MKTIVYKKYLKFLLFVFITTLIACTQYKNKPINRGYHNMTSRFNVYFYAKESLNEGVFKLKEKHKDDYTKILPVYIYGTKESCKEIFPEMDRVIKKSSICITRHAIKDKKSKQEIFGAVRWIDNAWMSLGKAHFYKREFFPAIETFEFVAHTYKSKEKYEAWLWLVKTYNEMNLLSQSDPYINLIKNDKKFPKQFKGDFEVLHAEFYIKQGLYEEAINKLTDAIHHTKNKKDKARYYFILGQLYELKENDNEKAIAYYKKTLAKKPAYEMEFNARIKLALLAEYTERSSKRLKSQLLKMLKDIKNDEYLDVIYYTLGQLEERDKEYEKAFKYYKLSAAKSKTNDVQKAKSYLRIAEMSFDNEEYPQSKTYYDSTLAFMKEDAVGYKDVVNKKSSLDVLVGHIMNIKTQDSLLNLAQMDSAARNSFIKKMIKKTEEDELKEKELKQQQTIAANNQVPNNNTNNAFQPMVDNNGAWYFYNQQTKVFGINDFIKKWGNQRKNEDNWRRFNKQSVADVWQTSSDTSSTVKDSTLVKEDSVLANKKTVAYYLKDIPLTKALQDSANKKIVDSYYALGTIYREQLNNNKRSISSFTTMNKRYSHNEYEPASYYQMYRIYLQEKNQPKADECKNFLIANYPTSDYTLIIKDPNFINAVNAKKSEVEAFYTTTYEHYTENNYSQALSNCNDALRKYSKNDYTPKFAYLRALCIGKTQPVDSLERALKSIVEKYVGNEIYAPAKALLDAINKTKNVTTPIDSSQIKAIDPDAYKLKDSSAHYWVVCIPQNRGDVNAFKTKLSNFNNQYYSIQKYQSQTLMLETTTLVLLKTFQDKNDVQSYNDFVIKKPELVENLQKEVISIFGISEENLILLLKKKNIEEYKTFYNKNYVNKKPS